MRTAGQRRSGSQRALGARGIPAARGSRSHGVAQRPGERLELRLHDVVRVAAVRARARAGRSAAWATKRLEDVPGHRRVVRRRSSAPCSPARCAPGTGGRTGRRSTCASASSSGTSASPNRRMPDLVAQRLRERLAERERGVLDRVVGVDVQVALGRARSGRTGRACRAGRACGRRTPTPGRRCRPAGAVEVDLDERPWSPWWSAPRGRRGSCARLSAPSTVVADRVEERVVLLRGADGDPQPARRTPSSRISTPRSSRRLPGRVRCRRTGRTARSSRRESATSQPIAAQPGDQPVPLGPEQRRPCRAARRCAAARRARPPGSRADRWYGSRTSCTRVDDRRVRGEVAEPRPADAERLAHRAGDDQPRRARAAAAARAGAGGGTRRTPRRRRPCPARGLRRRRTARAPSGLERGARSGCSGEVRNTTSGRCSAIAATGAPRGRCVKSASRGPGDPPGAGAARR